MPSHWADSTKTPTRDLAKASLAAGHRGMGQSQRSADARRSLLSSDTGSHAITLATVTALRLEESCGS
jgi:hypothetical protein